MKGWMIEWMNASEAPDTKEHYFFQSYKLRYMFVQGTIPSNIQGTLDR